jgi:hypothetical protein
MVEPLITRIEHKLREHSHTLPVTYDDYAKRIVVRLDVAKVDTKKLTRWLKYISNNEEYNPHNIPIKVRKVKVTNRTLDSRFGYFVPLGLGEIEEK